MSLLGIVLFFLGLWILGLSSLAIFLCFRAKRSRKVISSFCSRPADLCDLSDSEYRKVVDAGRFLGMDPREVEESKLLYPGSSVFEDPRLLSDGVRSCGKAVRPSVPPMPSEGDGDRWCKLCSKSAFCPLYYSGRFCGGSDFEDPSAGKGGAE